MKIQVWRDGVGFAVGFGLEGVRSMNLLIAWEEMREAIWEVRKFDRG